MDDPDNTPKPRRTPTQFIHEYLLVLCIPTALLTLLTFFARSHHLLELTVHFKPLYFLSALITTIAFTLLKRPRWAALSLLILLIHTPGILALHLPRQSTTPESQTPNLTLLSANILSYNATPERLIDYINKTQPDIILLQEVSPAWLPYIETLTKTTYPHHHIHPQSDNFGMATLSKHPLTSLTPLYTSDQSPISIEATLTINNRQLSILNYHPLPPGSFHYALQRNKQLAYTRDYTHQQPDLTIISGDLNITPWSPNYKDMMHDSGLYNTRQGYGILPTWPASSTNLLSLPVIPVIPIDHCLVSTPIQTLNLQRGPNIGSDHRPLLITLHIPAPPKDSKQASN